MENSLICPIENEVKVTQSSMEFSRPEFWSGQPFPSPGELPNPWIKPRSLTLQADSLPAELPLSASLLSLKGKDLFPYTTLFRSLVGSPCSPKDSQESSPTPQFKSIHSLVLSFLYSPTLTSNHDYWKNHSLDQMDLCWQSNVSAFQYAIQVGHNFPSKE